MIRKYSSAPKLDLVNFWQLVLFSWITGNADMHLKNFSLWSERKGIYHLTPGYDLIATALVMPEDTEELALALNGKKRKLTRSDFKQAMLVSGLEEKVIDNLFGKFQKVAPRWFDFMKLSFLPEEMREAFVELVTNRLGILRDG